MQKNISGFLLETLEKTGLFQYKEADGRGIISALLFTRKVSKEEVPWGKIAVPKGTDFLINMFNITYKEIL